MRSGFHVSALAVALTIATSPAYAGNQPSGVVTPAPTLSLSPSAYVKQGAARVGLGVARALTVPAHVWPLNRIVEKIAHGEPFAGLTAKGATKTAIKVSDEGHGDAVIGRLAPAALDKWTARGTEKSFMAVIDRLAAARGENPNVRGRIAFDPYALGYGLAGVAEPQRREFAMATMMRIAEHAKAEGVPVEMDMADHKGFAFTVEAARNIVTTLGIPVRLALPARFADADKALKQWAKLARDTGMKLGVRLVKGSSIDSDDRKSFNTHELLRAHYQRLISLALKNDDVLDVGVATQNEEVWRFTQREAERQGGAKYAMHVIRGVNPKLQDKMRAEDHIAQEYISYGPDAMIFGVNEGIQTLKQKAAIAKKLAPWMAAQVE